MMKLNAVYQINNHYVYITDGAYWVGGRLSNAWSGYYVMEDGSLSTEKWSGYGKDYREVKHTVTIKIED